MTTNQFADRLGNVDEEMIQQATDSLLTKHVKHNRRKIVFMLAAVLAILAMCGFAAYEAGLFDFWIQTPATIPVESVQSAIENQIEKEYAKTVRVDEVIIDEDETIRKIKEYTGSELAEIRGWTDNDLKEHFVAVRAKYYVEYDHSKTFLEDGEIEQYFYLMEDADSGMWVIVDNTGNGEPLSH